MSLYIKGQKITRYDSGARKTFSLWFFLQNGGTFKQTYVDSFEGFFLPSDFKGIADMSYMFYDCVFLKSVPMLDTSAAMNMSYMFGGCTSLHTVPVFDTSNVTNMDYMFYNCRSFKDASYVPSLNTSKVTNMRNMFYSCSSLTSIPSFNTSSVTNMYAMFLSCRNLRSVPSLDASNVTNMSSMFSGCSSLEEIHMTGMKVSFDISASTKFTREALVEIIGNLAEVTSTQTLTMGSTNLAKLTDDDKAVATGKGWTLV